MAADGSFSLPDLPPLLYRLEFVLPTPVRGGLRVKVQQVWDLAGARCRFGKYLHVTVGGKAPDVPRLVREFPPVREEIAEGELLHGLRVRMGVRCQSDDAAAVAELQLGENARFYPSDAALAAWTAQVGAGAANVVYE